jgi:hypothetical protein
MILVAMAAVWLPAAPPAWAKKPSGSSGCQLKSAKGDIEHVIFLIFDNVHFLRDNPNVPSDLEQNKSNTSGDGTYQALSDQLQDLTARRDALAGQMRSLLDGAAFKRTAISEGFAHSLIHQAEHLLDEIHAAAQP